MNKAISLPLNIWKFMTIIIIGFGVISSTIHAKENIDLFEMEKLFLEEERFVVAASRVKEHISEAPAIVTVITEEMIKNMGARHLMDVLFSIPGFNHIQDLNEHVVSSRGIFASTTQKFLVLRDGHRLNAPLFELVLTDYSISLENIKRIEVMRGTGASIYGNASLAAVVNIITKDGDEVDGLKLIAGGGNFGQQKYDLLYGEKFNDKRELMAYGSFYKSQGEKVSQSIDQDFSASPVEGEQFVDRRDANYDAGLKFRAGDFQFSASMRRSHYAHPRSNGGQLIDYYSQRLNMKQELTSSYLDLQYTKKKDVDSRFIDNYSILVRPYFDYNKLITNQITLPRRERPPDGKIFVLNLKDIRYGGEISTTIEHEKGTFLIGTQVEEFELVESVIESNFSDPDVLQRVDSLPEETEWNTAFYMQEKFTLMDGVIINGGFRYDYYEVFGGSINPRAALIFNPFGSFHLKLIYGESFQAPSYFYRHSNPALGYGSTGDLNPEEMTTYQVGIENSFGNFAWLRTNFFYNELDDLISRDNTSTPSIYRNFEGSTIWGFETELKVKLLRQLSISTNHTYLKPVVSETDAALIKDGELKNVPSNTFNVDLNYRPFNFLNINLNMNSWLNAIKSPVGGTGKSGNEPDNEIPSQAIFNLTLRAEQFWEEAEISLKIHNLFDKRYYLGGTPLVPYPQEGRSILFTAGYKF